ncbi:MAG: hypothetical protein KAR14_10885 [Candidatus Aminicenantes bacterium]|nr:hypothetical protein [Candidatus Aminicenantes bacterium]
MFFKLIVSLLLLVQPAEIVVDKIAAVVNDEIITVSDIDKSLLLYSPVENSGSYEEDLYLKELDKLINHKVVFLEYKDQFELSEEDFENVQRSIIERYGSMDDTKRILEKFDMDLKDFRLFLTEKILYEKVIEDKFKLGVVIEFSDIEEFYKNDYLPSRKKLGIEPKSIIDMTPVIENFLRGKKVRKELSQWLEGIKASYSIKNILSDERKRDEEEAN